MASIKFWEKGVYCERRSFVLSYKQEYIHPNQSKKKSLIAYSSKWTYHRQAFNVKLAWLTMSAINLYLIYSNVGGTISRKLNAE